LHKQAPHTLLPMQELTAVSFTRLPSALWKGQNCDDLWAIPAAKQPAKMAGCKKDCTHFPLLTGNLKEHSMAGCLLWSCSRRSWRCCSF